MTIDKIEREPTTFATIYFGLLAAFLGLVLAAKFDLLPDRQLNIGLLALITGLFGYALKGSATQAVRLPTAILALAVGLVLVFRIAPYLGNPVPLGYDPGLYKYVFDHPTGDPGVESTYPMLFSLVMSGLNALFGSQFLLVPFFVVLSVANSLAIYFAGAKLFNRQTGIIAALLFAVSMTQFQVFWYNYYKNVLGIPLLLISLTLFHRDERINWRLVLVGGLIGGIHRPAFLLFAATYLIWTLLDIRQFQKPAFRYAILNGMLIIGLALLFNLDRIDSFLLRGVFRTVTESSIGGSEAGGAFFNFNVYVVYSLSMLPFAVTGVLHRWRKAPALAIACGTTLFIVLLRLYFYNRFIIYLDIFVILYAASGFELVLGWRKHMGAVVTLAAIVLLLSGVGLRAMRARPLISAEEFEEIKIINTLVEDGATIVVSDQHYAPWFRGWVDRRIIAPGLFGYDAMDETDWQNFWQDIDREDYLREIGKPVYVHVGERQLPLTFDEDCYEDAHPGQSQLYRYVCP